MGKNYDYGSFFIIPKIEPFELDIRKANITVDPKKGDAKAHIHSYFEIFLNISGNIDFIVGNHIYSLSHGDLIIIKPNEYHHSIYKHPCTNEYFYIHFPANGNEKLFGGLMELSDKTGGAINLSTRERDHIIAICDDIISAPQDTPDINKYLKFFEMLNIIYNTQNIKEKETKSEPQFDSINAILDYINDNIDSASSVKDIASKFHISIKTLERLFITHIGQTPKGYISMLRLSKASEYLRDGKSVTDVCYMCGFKNCSRFIQDFKKQFGETPFQYKKRFLNSVRNAYYLNE